MVKSDASTNQSLIDGATGVAIEGVPGPYYQAERAG
jgi:hypothetical protein